MDAQPRLPPPVVAPPPGNPRFPMFDGLRALAALSVLIYHVGFYSRANEGQDGLSPYLARLNVGVAVFFVISGFLLLRPMLVGRLGNGPRVRLRDYARRRFLRIVPAYWVAVTVLAVFGRLARIGGRRGVWWQLELVVLAALMAASAAWRGYVDAHGGLPPSTFASTFAWFALGMALAGIAIAAGALSYYVVERPALRLKEGGRRLRPAKDVVAEPAVDAGPSQTISGSPRAARYLQSP